MYSTDSIGAATKKAQVPACVLTLGQFEFVDGNRLCSLAGVAIGSKYEGCLHQRARQVIVHIVCVTRNLTESQCSYSGEALNEINKETGELHLPNDFGRIEVFSMYFLALL